MKKTTTETPRNACRKARTDIARLMKMLEAELDDREMFEDGWPIAGSLGHVRELLGEAVGFLKGVEGSEILDAITTKKR